MKKKHDNNTIKGNKCPHCGEIFPSVIAVHQHILDDHQQIVAEERESQAMDRLRKEQERAEKDRIREENRRRREDRRKERMDFNDFRPKGMKEWEINYEFHLGDGLVRGVDWDRTPSNGELPCDQCPRKFGWRYEIMFHSLCHMMDPDGNPKNKVCPECDTVFKVPIGLKHHLLLHTGELPFLCLHCWRSFSSHIDLKLHIRREHLFHLDMPASKSATSSPKVKKLKGENMKEEIKSGEFIAVTADGSAGETLEGEAAAVAGQHQVQFVMAAEGEEGDHEGAQTIVLNSDAAAQYVDSNGQDMIVVIQSDDFDQSQGLIVVDPSQLQQMVSSGSAQAVTTATSSGMTIVQHNPTTTTATIGNENQEMIVSDQNNDQGGSQDEYITLQMPDGSQGQTMVLAQEGAEGEQGEQGYIVVTAQEDSKGNILLQHQEQQPEQEVVDQKTKSE